MGFDYQEIKAERLSSPTLPCRQLSPGLVPIVFTTASRSAVLAVRQTIFQLFLTCHLRVAHGKRRTGFIVAGAADVNAVIQADRDAVNGAYNSALTDVFVRPNQPAKQSRTKSDAVNNSFPLWGPPSPSYWSAA